jgi:hypothetical protein
VNFYDQVLREIVLAVGAALFVANGLALLRRRADAQAALGKTVARHRPGSPVRGYRSASGPRDFTQAPVARTVTYMTIGFVVMVWGLASVINS